MESQKEEEEEEEEKRKKVTSRSTEELVLKNEDFWNSNGDITTGNMYYCSKQSFSTGLHIFRGLT